MENDLNKSVPKILIIDFGSQYTQVIGRTLRELGFRSVILPNDKAVNWLEKNNPCAIILSGGHGSVNSSDSPKIPEIVWQKRVPILGICYGMQYIAKFFGGEVFSSQDSIEYGPAKINIDNSNELFIGMDDVQDVWMSHGDTVKSLPEGFKSIASSENYKNCAIYSENKNIWAVQFHPEVTHTKNGREMLRNFVKNICNCSEDWFPENIISNIRNHIKNNYNDKKVLIGFSGGVDSVTLTAVLSPIFGKNLIAFCLDAGQFRIGELDYIEKTAKNLGVSFKLVDKSIELEEKIKNVINSQEKRMVFRDVYRNAFNEAVKKFSIDLIAQGSLATDFIESGAKGQGSTIKTHHNIGLNMQVEQIHPFRDLFKYEVRELAERLDLGDEVVNREPFPGPGLILRVVGDSVTKERLDLVRFADDVVRNTLKKHNLLNKQDISQLVVYLLAGVKLVGIKGDNRVYDSPIVVRGIKTVDFMTGDGVQLPRNVRKEIILSITKHKDVSRVMFDETPKPPATTEPE